jgi:hypothetical protein
MMRVVAIISSAMVMVLLSGQAARPHHDDVPDPPAAEHALACASEVEP